MARRSGQPGQPSHPGRAWRSNQPARCGRWPAGRAAAQPAGSAKGAAQHGHPGRRWTAAAVPTHAWLGPTSLAGMARNGVTLTEERSRGTLVLDKICAEMNHQFSEATTEILLCFSCLEPCNSFFKFDVNKLACLAKIYI